ncbi:MAG: cyclase family protein [Clostridia bacterium]|nr:cyclase family protein [Clostridia bacterium]
MQIIDISRDITRCDIYPGDPDVKFDIVSNIANGDSCNLSAIYTGLHNGTHADAPLHFIDGGDSIEKADLSAFIGECHVIEVPVGPISGEYVNKYFPTDAKRIIIKSAGRAWFMQSGAEEVAFSGVKLIGTDANSVGTHGAQTGPHVAFLRENVAVLENLDLCGVKPGKYFLLAQPLKIGGAEAAPVRAVLLADFIFWSGSKA